VVGVGVGSVVIGVATTGAGLAAAVGVGLLLGLKVSLTKGSVAGWFWAAFGTAFGAGFARPLTCLKWNEASWRRLLEFATCDIMSGRKEGKIKEGK
jgi:hypothetical protein